MCTVPLPPGVYPIAVENISINWNIIIECSEELAVATLQGTRSLKKSLVYLRR